MEISEEWNEIARERLMDRLAGNDTSYNTVLLPSILNRIKKNKSKFNSILDFGCGTGEMTYEIAKLDIDTVGVDISENSINIAADFFKHSKLKFYSNTLSDLNFESTFDLIVANMSLMDTEDLNTNFGYITKALKDSGIILINVIHPCFWPIYWNYYNDIAFKYLTECKITKTYKTSKTIFEGFETSHYHRPISSYIKLFSDFDFKINDMQELRNPNDKTWYPRFLYFEIEKRDRPQ